MSLPPFPCISYLQLSLIVNKCQSHHRYGHSNDLIPSNFFMIEDVYKRQAWGLATLFVYQREKVLALLQSDHLDEFTHNKAIQKMRESYRISPQDKAMLRDMRRKNSK